MEINRLTAADFSTLAKASTNSPANSPADRQVVSAVQQLNQSSALGENRKLTYRRDVHTGQFVIQIVNRTSGDVVDQIPMEALLRLQAEVEQELKAKTSLSTESGMA